MKQTTLLLCLFLAFSAFAQDKISIEDIFESNVFYPKSVYGVRWMNDGQFYTSKKGQDIVKNDVTTGKQVATIVSGADLAPQITWDEYSFSADESKILFQTAREQIYRRSYKAKFYVFDRKTKQLKVLAEGKQSYATFSPDGKKVAFVQDNDLFYVQLSDMKVYRITKNGKYNHIINGSTDWVYEEEFYLTKAFFWAPGSKKIAYCTFDESEVKAYNMQTWPEGGQALYPLDYKFKYPKAGEKNAVVSVSVFDLATQKTVSAEVGKEKNQYIPRLQWTQNPDLLSVRRMNRLQNRLDVLHINATDGSSKIVHTETSKTYIDVNEETLVYLKNGKHFLRSSEKDGYKHFYLYDMEGKELAQITKGNWEVTEFLGIDESKKKPILYYLSTEISPLERHFYSIEIDSRKKEKRSVESGTHHINMSKDFKYYLDYHSNAEKPLNVKLFDTKKNKAIQTLEDNNRLATTAKKYGIVPKTFFTFKTAENITLNGYMLRPADFDEKKKYPVLMFQYSGPGSQQVQNNFGGRNFWWHQMLVQKGYIVVVVDGRGTGGRGADFKKITYRQLGKLETQDQIHTAKYLQTLPYIDGKRIGIWGWSFGGYMSALCMMRGADYFKAGIAVAPVTSWRFYDTIYTERYLGLPKDNPTGYDENSPLSHTEKLRGAFLLVHGTGDDNVHFQNAIALQDALIASNKQFQSFYYPNRAHGIHKNQARRHLYKMMTDFLLQNL